LGVEFRNYTSGSVVHMLQLSDEGVERCLFGAVALVIPQSMKVLGLPVMGLIACGCPVITCPSLYSELEKYMNDNDVDGMANALCDAQKPGVLFIGAAGLNKPEVFMVKMAETVSSALLYTLLPLNLRGY